LTLRGDELAFNIHSLACMRSILLRTTRIKFSSMRMFTWDMSWPRSKPTTQVRVPILIKLYSHRIFDLTLESSVGVITM